MQAKDKRKKLDAIRKKLPLDKIAPFARSLAQFPYFRRIYAGAAMPGEFSELRNHYLLSRSDLERELIWTAAVLKNFEDLLTAFVAQERRFVDAWMLGEFGTASRVLDEVEGQYGKSGWLIERRLALLQEAEGLDAQKAFSYSIRAEQSSSEWAKYYAFNFSMRMEPTVSTATYARMIDGQASKAQNPDFQSYMSFRFSMGSTPPHEHYLGILGWDENSPIVDRYLHFLRLAQQICISQTRAFASVFDQLSNALRQSELAVVDYRLDNIRFVLGLCEDPERPNPCRVTLSVFDNYATGDYERALKDAHAILQQQASRADVYEIFVKAALQLGQRVDVWPKGSPISRIFVAYENIIIRSPLYVESVEALQKLSLVINDPAISAHASHLLGRERLRDELTSETELAANINAPIGNPWQLTAFNTMSRSSLGGAALFSDHITSPSLRLQAAISLPIGNCDEVLELPIFSEVPEYRRDFYSARILERHGRLVAASERYERWLGSAYPPLYFDSVLRLTWARFLTQAYDDVLQLIVRTYLRSPFAYVSMPVAEVLFAVQASDPSHFAKTPALAIVHDIYFRHIATNLDGERSDAFEDYLTCIGVARPSHLRDIVVRESGTGRDILIHYLRYICVPRIMDHYTEFEGTTDLLTERISICQVLAEVDSENATAYTDEIRSTTQELVVSEGVRQIEQSRIYVDTDSIRAYIEKPFNESYARYVQLPAGSTAGSSRRIVLHQIGEVVSDSQRSALYIPLDERTAFLGSMIEQFGVQFVMNPRHGLSAYLSGRIRHGILPNHLRSPLQLAQLATLKDSKTGTYRPNEYWTKQLPGLDADVSETLGLRLASFTKQIDESIELINQKWIQINRPHTPDGLFDFSYGAQDLAVLEPRVQAAQTYDEFVDILFQFFWDFTEGSLARVRARIDNELKPRIVGAFDNLESDISGILSGVNYSELDAAITKARTNMLGTLEAVKGWFKLSKAAEKPDFELSTLIEIAVRSTNNIFRYAQLTPRTELEVAMRLQGRTLTNLVELICLLLSNIVLRSGVSTQSANVEIYVRSIRDEWIQFSIENDVHFATDKDREEAEKNISDVKELLLRNDPSIFLDRNRGTGYARVQKILTHDLKCDHRIEFGLAANRFKVVVEIDASLLKVSPQ